MQRDFAKEIDELKGEIGQIKELLMGRMNPPVGDNSDGTLPQQCGHIYKMHKLHEDADVMRILDKAENECGTSGSSGRITYVGVYKSSGRQSTWVRNLVNTDDLLQLIENKTAEKVLACIGNSDRLNMLLALLKKPMSVAQLVENCGFNTTGQVYHLLKPLISADLVTEDEKNEGRGVYAVQPHRVQGILMLLAGISDMLDPKYTQGAWED